MSTFLRDVINIPLAAGDNDYVLRLTEGVGKGRLAGTVDQYVVTDGLAEAFDRSLGLVSAALRDGQSRAAFLSGSFGSGKSHFMAVLHALLGHDASARSKDELASVIAKHDPQLEGKKVLRLAYHFLDAKSIEDAILGGYVAQIQALEPDADLPAVHRGDSVLADGEQMRQRLGDDPFFAALNEHGGSSVGADPWTAVLEGTPAWDSESYDTARAAAPGSEQRQGLVSALVRTFFTAYTNTAEFVSLDEGLLAITRHAKGLGYDAVVMFLDELVLWLAFNVRNKELFGREAQKITKFIEAGSGERAVPIISFVARQMDLRRYFNDASGGIGSEQEAIDSAFRHQEGRFATIVLGDDNLPYVAEKRLLKPLDDEAKGTLDDAFRRLERRPEVWDVLLDGVNTDDQNRGADQVAFRRTYPFSPALVSTLRTLASAMQRDRTALKVMQQLLVRQRDTLTVEDVIPVGDIFDFVVEGNQALTPEMAGRFKNARSLYEEKLRPVLLREHGLTLSDVAALPAKHPYRADDRLAKTLVLSAVAPEVPALKEITASRLAALNHGSITSPLPGKEASVVLGKLERWNGDVPEIQIARDSRNPVIRLRISEVDYESIIEKAKGEDNDGRRRETLKKLAWEAFGLSDLDGDISGVSRQSRVWRGSRRDVEVLFGNVRDSSWLPDAAFEAGQDTWRFVIDYPFDEDGRSARDDLDRLEELRAQGVVSRTVAWVPYFLSRERRDDLGRLVILDWLLGGPGDRWTSHANHLAEADRVQAKIILESQRDALRNRVSRALQQAYGASAAIPGTLEAEEGHDRVLLSLDPEFTPAAPVGHDLGAAFGNLIEQAFTATFPGHPRFEPEDREVRANEITAVLNAVQSANREKDGRAFVETRQRDAVRRVANPLSVGHMGETHFLFGPERFRWAMEFERAMGRDGLATTDPVQVKSLRGWISALEPAMGLRPELADLIICAWAVQQNRAWYRHGGPLVPAPVPGALTPDAELRPEKLPSAGDWEAAVLRAGVIFKAVGNPFLTGSSVNELAQAVLDEVGECAAQASDLVKHVEGAYRRLGITAADTGRLATATASRDFVTALKRAPDRVALIEVLAAAAFPATDQSVAKTLSSAGAVSRALADYNWDRLKPLLAAAKANDERGLNAKAILDRLRATLLADELVQPLAQALKRAEDESFSWAVTTPSPAPADEPTEADTDAPVPPSKPAARPMRRSVSSRAELDDAVDALHAFIDEHQGRNVIVEWRAES
ncbi:hypothetical protein ACIQCG_34210 [Streptomyces noursei]|uniref:hypothetical protein n=1 Tax=Streptomyces noursei TaxID=1971 RepID=UPI0038043240